MWHSSGTDSHPVTPGFTILELLTVMGVVSTLMALLLPALGAVRETARKLQCTNQLKQIGVALHNYHDVHRSLPPGTQWEQQRQTAYGWNVAILPFLEQQAVYKQVNRNQVLSHPENMMALQAQIPLLVCPSDLTEPHFLLYEDPEQTSGLVMLATLPTSSYPGVFGTQEPDDECPAPAGDGTFLDARSIRFTEFQNGLSNTMVVGERTMRKFTTTWLGVDKRADDAPCYLLGNALTTPNCQPCDECEFDSRHPGGANFLYGDGTVRFVSESIDTPTYQRMARRF